jgi:hypothetical protein
MDRMTAKGKIMQAFILTLLLSSAAFATAPSNEHWYTTEVESWNEAAGHFVYSGGTKIIAPTAETDYPWVVITRVQGDFVNIPFSLYAVERAETYGKAAIRAGQTSGRVTTAVDGAILVYYRR